MKLLNIALSALLVVSAQPVWSVAASSNSNIEQFCVNITDPARERRYALKRQELDELRDRIEKRMGELETRKAELEEWVVRRDAFVEQAREGLVGIYSRMRPDAAAERLTMLSDELAAAIIMKMKTSQASIILNEMESKKAAAISVVIAASGAGSKS
ncbi:MAG: MotE family protein [Ahrensia sp.]|nr:MotE family protein [Ahrensia sp.]